MKTFIIIMIVVILIVVILRTINFLKRKKSRSHNIDPAAAEAFRKYLEMIVMVKKTMGSQGN
jgi:predicted nucleic acid-binding protein